MSRSPPPPPLASVRNTGGVIQGRFQGLRPRVVTAHVQAKTASNSNVTEVPSGLLNLNGRGRPLPDALRQRMEQFFQTSFADVRVHEGPQAPSIGALAFTTGSDLYFAPGQYNPDSPQGRVLLGHELTHVVQQKSGRVRGGSGGGLRIVQDVMLEMEADRMGQRSVLFCSQAVGSSPRAMTSSPLPVQAKEAPPRHGTPSCCGQPHAGVGSVLQRANFGRPLLAPQPTKLEYDGSTQGTFATMNVYRVGAWGIEADQPTISQYFASGGGYHAEEKAIAHLQARVNDGTLTHHNNGLRPDWKVVLFLSKSPCSSTSFPATRTDGQPGCAERLTDLYMNGLNNPLGETVIFIVNLAATKLYQPKIVGGKDASQGSYDGFGGGGLSFGTVR